MYILIIGCGRLGSSLAMELSNEGHDVSIVDKDQEDLERLGSGFNGQIIKGVEIDHDILLQAGIDKADVFLAMTPDDNINIMASQIAKNIFGVKKVLARISDPSREVVYRKLGLEAISPTQLGVSIVKSRIIEKGSEILAALDDETAIVEIPILKTKIADIKELEEKYNCAIAALIRAGKVKIIRKDEIIQLGDIVICAIDKKNRERLVQAVAGEMKV
jgi:trk system potassium uptake protein TrkA